MEEIVKYSFTKGQEFLLYLTHQDPAIILSKMDFPSRDFILLPGLPDNSESRRYVQVTMEIPILKSPYLFSLQSTALALYQTLTAYKQFS